MESKRVGSLDVDAQRSGSLETLNPLRFQGETVVLVVLPGLSTAIMVISFLECPGRLKCLATGFSLLFFASPQCSRRRCLRVLFGFTHILLATPFASDDIYGIGGQTVEWMADGEVFFSSGAGDGITGNSMLDSVSSMLVFTSSTLLAGGETRVGSFYGRGLQRRSDY